MNKFYAFSDIHGNYNLLKQILTYCDETDTLYFLGDAADRGPDGLKCMEALLNDIRVIYLMGNHEVMFLNSYKEYKRQEQGEYIDFYESALLLWINNGADATWYSFLEEYNQEQQSTLYYKIKHLPFEEKIQFKDKEIILNHSGGRRCLG